MNSKGLDILRELTEGAASVVSPSSSSGRYARTPDFTSAGHGSTRPSTDRGTTFHFSHKAISKGSDASASRGQITPAVAHQGYIERPSATEEMDSKTREILMAPRPEEPGEESLLHPGFTYPQRSVARNRISFGTLGEMQSERKSFWSDVEVNEGRKGRVQNRIIAELPVELTSRERAGLALEFCRVLEDRSLPYWATVHAPSKRNDPRNFHLHVAYYDRPSGRREDGSWDFGVVEEQRKSNGTRRRRRPFRNNKHPDTRHISWPRQLRTEFSDISNFYLSLSGSQKRNDPRSYRDAGLEKEPTEHLGNTMSALESMGLETETGKRNAKREIRWRIRKAESPWVSRYKQVSEDDLFANPSLEQVRDSLIEIASRGITLARKKASHEIASELLSYRITRRASFLDDEVFRLRNKEDMSDFARKESVLANLENEKMVIEDRRPIVEKGVRYCRVKAEEFSEEEAVLATRFDRLHRDHDLRGFLESMDGPDLEDVPAESRNRKGGDKPISQSMDTNLDPIQVADVLDDIDTLFEGTPSLGHSTPVRTGEGRKTQDRKVEDPILLAIQSLAESAPDDSAQHDEQGVSSEKNSLEESFPEAWKIQASPSKEDLVRIDASLAEFDNRALRHAAIATRDAADLSPRGEGHFDYARGWAVLRYEAQRRGLDLDTGHHHPEAGIDPERAYLHKDEAPCSIRVVRKNLARQRVRG